MCGAGGRVVPTDKNIFMFCFVINSTCLPFHYFDLLDKNIRAAMVQVRGTHIPEKRWVAWEYGGKDK